MIIDRLCHWLFLMQEKISRLFFHLCYEAEHEKSVGTSDFLALT